ncbi:MAG: hypothetical protein ACI9WU_001073 [Myxococcota bacterium]|jgi:hypothetical protein
MKKAIRMRMTVSVLILMASATTIGCSGESSDTPAPTPDAGAADTSGQDAGTDGQPEVEAPDAGPEDTAGSDPCGGCDDGNPCTADVCNEAKVCESAWVEGCCFTDEECAEGLVCTDHACAWDASLCATAGTDLPEGLITLEWHGDEGVADVTKQTWSVTDAALPLASERINEAVRFELDHPARIHGFSVRFATLPSNGGKAVSAGLHPDFGYNGFDFWQSDPYWTGSHCAGDIQTNEWVVYAFDEPVTIDHPGLVYVAHPRQGDDDAAWLFDGSSTQEDGSCGNWSDCHSSINLPDLHQGTSGGQGFWSWNGLSLQLQFDFVVRLHVEYTDDVTPDQGLFQPMDLLAGPNRHSIGDFDNDGDDDVFTAGNGLWRNDAGVLVDVTADSGIPEMDISGSGGVWGDFDNDGCLDLFVFVESGTSANHLLRGGCDGTFTNVSTASLLSDGQDYNDCAGAGHDHAPAPAAAWWDIDSDGLLDLYVSNMICWSDFSFYNDQVWRNNGDNTFSEWTGLNGFAGLDDTARSSRGANPVDYDGDGDVDLLVNRYTLHPNALYRNNGDGTVTDVAEEVGAAGVANKFFNSTNYGHSIGATWGDLDGDGDFDAVVANLAHPRFFSFSDKSQVLLQDNGEFTDIQGAFTYPMGDAGLRYSETHSVPNLGDFDQDGALDLVITAVYPGRPTDFYWGNGDGTFVLDAYRSGLTLTNGWGVVHSDLDHDGDLDLVTSGGAYRNTVASPGRWLQVRAVGNVASNRAAIGATVRVVVDGKTRIGYVSGGNGQGGQDSQTVHFGLGAIASEGAVESVSVTFPGGGTVQYAGPFDADQRLWLFEDGTIHAGWAPPPP